MDDRIIYHHQGVTLSYSYLYADNKKILIKDIISAEPRIIKPKCLLARLFMFSGLPFLFAGDLLLLLGIFLMVIGFLLYKAAKLRFGLWINMKEGNYTLLSSNNLIDIENIVAAVNLSLAMRDNTNSSFLTDKKQ